MKDRIIGLLQLTAKYPQMYVGNEEALITRVTTLMEVVAVGYYFGDFYRRHFPNKKGANVVFERPDGIGFDDWARSVIADAIEMVKGTP